MSEILKLLELWKKSSEGPEHFRFIKTLTLEIKFDKSNASRVVVTDSCNIHNAEHNRE